MSFIHYYPSVHYPVQSSASDEWQGLSWQEIISAFPQGTFSRDAKKSRPKLLSEVCALRNAETKMVLGAALKCKRECRSATVPGRIAEKLTISTVDAVLCEWDSHDVDIGKFMDVPTQECVQECHASYLAATSNKALEQVVCQSCARRLWRHRCTLLELNAAPNLFLLKPKHPHPAHDLYEGMLIVPEVLKEVLDPSGRKLVYGYFCKNCLRCLEDSPCRIPPSEPE